MPELQELQLVMLYISSMTEYGGLPHPPQDPNKNCGMQTVFSTDFLAVFKRLPSLQNR